MHVEQPDWRQGKKERSAFFFASSPAAVKKEEKNWVVRPELGDSLRRENREGGGGR